MTMAEQDDPGNRDGMCVAAHGCQRHAVIGFLCRGHFERMGAMLRDIEDEAAILSAVPSMQQNFDAGGGSLASHRAPALLDVLVLNDGRRNVLPYEKPPVGPACWHCWHETCMLIRNYEDAYNASALQNMSVLNTLHSWTRVVRAERKFVGRDEVTISGERDTLTRSLDWIAEQPYVDEFYSDLTKLLGQLRAANGTAADKPVGRCYLPKTDGLCGGAIWVDMAAGHAYCAKCKETWDGEQLAILRHGLEQDRREAARPRTDDGRRMLTAEEMVAAGHARTVSAVKTTYHRLGLVSTDGHYDPAIFSKATA